MWNSVFQYVLGFLLVFNAAVIAIHASRKDEVLRGLLLGFSASCSPSVWSVVLHLIAGTNDVFFESSLMLCLCLAKAGVCALKQGLQSRVCHAHQPKHAPRTTHPSSQVFRSGSFPDECPRVIWALTSARLLGGLKQCCVAVSLENKSTWRTWVFFQQQQACPQWQQCSILWSRTDALTAQQSCLELGVLWPGMLSGEGSLGLTLKVVCSPAWEAQGEQIPAALHGQWDTWGVKAGRGWAPHRRLSSLWNVWVCLKGAARPVYG